MTITSTITMTITNYEHEPSTLNPRPSTLDPQPSTLNPRLSTLDPRPSTLDSQPSTINYQRSRVQSYVFHRRCIQKYCSGWRRINVSISRFIAAVRRSTSAFSPASGAGRIGSLT